jgi:hypothetical protein
MEGRKEEREGGREEGRKEGRKERKKEGERRHVAGSADVKRTESWLILSIPSFSKTLDLFFIPVVGIVSVPAS